MQNMILIQVAQCGTESHLLPTFPGSEELSLADALSGKRGIYSVANNYFTQFIPRQQHANATFKWEKTYIANQQRRMANRASWLPGLAMVTALSLIADFGFMRQFAPPPLVILLHLLRFGKKDFHSLDQGVSRLGF